MTPQAQPAIPCILVIRPGARRKRFQPAGCHRKTLRLDLRSARALNRELLGVLAENQIYRIVPNHLFQLLRLGGQQVFFQDTHVGLDDDPAATLSRFTSIPCEAIATIGDMPNDVLMFRKSGLSTAMRNASPEVQAQADFVTDSHDDEGFATAMERFILPRAHAVLPEKTR